MANRIYRRTGKRRVGRSVMDLSYSKLFDADMGLLYPIMNDEAVPGDVFKIQNEIVLRFNPLLAPLLHEINVYIHYFFVPYRILWDEWETFITKGVDGDQVRDIPVYPAHSWSSSEHSYGFNTLYHYFFGSIASLSGTQPQHAPNAWPLYAYNMIWNEYYRDRNVMQEIALNDPSKGQYGLLRRCWEKDYFTSALPWQQRGTAPALPISGSINVDASDAVYSLSPPPTGTNSANVLIQNTYTPVPPAVGPTLTSESSTYTNMLRTALNKQKINLSSASTFDVSDLRLAFQIQRWMELNARAGNRYTEFLRAHFPASPRDDRLQRPEYIGGSKSPVVISEVLQTSENSTTPQGNMAGHGLSVDRTRVTTYRVQEFGIIMGLLSVMPRASYSGILDRQWLRRTPFDFYFPEFQHLSEQAITRQEISPRYNLTETGANTIFGYQGRYNEMRSKHSMICGKMSTDFQHWHLARDFISQSAPVLSQQFLECNPRKNIFAVPSEPGMIINVSNRIRAIRPMTAIPVPGLIDH